MIPTATALSRVRRRSAINGEPRDAEVSQRSRPAHLRTHLRQMETVGTGPPIPPRPPAKKDLPELGEDGSRRGRHRAPSRHVDADFFDPCNTRGTCGPLQRRKRASRVAPAEQRRAAVRRSFSRSYAEVGQSCRSVGDRPLRESARFRQLTDARQAPLHPTATAVVHGPTPATARAIPCRASQTAAVLRPWVRSTLQFISREQCFWAQERETLVPLDVMM